MNFWALLAKTGLFVVSVSIVSYTAYFYLNFEKPDPGGAPTPSSHQEAEELPQDLESMAKSVEMLATAGGIRARAEGNRIYIDIPNKALFFDSDSFALGKGSKAAIRAILGNLRGYSHLLVSGHADSAGDWLHNHELSKRRAEAVVDLLIEIGAEPENVTSFGFGESEPLASNFTEEGKARNRRVQIEAIYGKSAPPVVKIVEVTKDSCEQPADWKEALTCSLKNNTWILLAGFFGSVATLLGFAVQIVRK